MTIQEISNRLIELTTAGQYEQAQKELYAANAVSHEPAGSPALPTVEGLDNIIAKGHQFQSMIEAVHSSHHSDPIIMGTHFAIGAMMDVTLKGMGRQKMEEIAVYEVKDGKIVKEEFFYQV
jgi:hypothetical protein